MHYRTILVAALVVLASVGAGTAGASTATLANQPTAAHSGPTPAASAAEGGVDRSGTTALQAACSFPFSATDATGTEVTVSEDPDRVVTLNPSAAQTMWEIGARDEVVGVSQFAVYLDGAANKTVVTQGNPMTVQVETVVSLNADLVLAPNTVGNDTVEKLRAAGQTVYRFPAATSIEDVARKTELIGRLTGNCAGANETVDRMNAELAVVSEAIAGQDRPSVYVPLGGGFTAGTGTFVHEAVTTAGGTNVAAEANITFYGQLSNEVLIQQDPEYVVVMYYTPTPPEDPRSLLPKNDALNRTTAVREGNVVAVNGNNISQPAPRIVSAVGEIASSLHPEAYAQARADAEANASADGDTTTATATPTPTPEGQTAETTDTTTATDPDDSAATTATESDGGPQSGFGAGLAAVTLAAAALVLARRD